MTRPPENFGAGLLWIHACKLAASHSSPLTPRAVARAPSAAESLAGKGRDASVMNRVEAAGGTIEGAPSADVVGEPLWRGYTPVVSPGD